MIKLDPTKDTKLKFKIDVMGTKETPRPRLSLQQEGRSYGFHIRGAINGDVVSFVVPKKICEQFGDNVSGELEIMVGNEIFHPWKDDIVFEEKFRLEVQPLGEEEIKDQETQTIVTVEEVKEDEDQTSQPLSEQEEPIEEPEVKKDDPEPKEEPEESKEEEPVDNRSKRDKMKDWLK